MKKDKRFTIELPEIVNYSDSDYDVAENMLNSLFYNYSTDRNWTSLPYWMDQFSNHTNANRMILRLVEDNWIITRVVKTNWAEMAINPNKLLEMFTNDELVNLIKYSKLDKKFPYNDSVRPMEGATDVKLPSGTQKTGIIRMGFSKCSNHEFSYDLTMLTKYRNEVIKVTAKSMRKQEQKLGYSLRNPDGYDYESIIELVIDEILNDPYATYRLGKVVMDSRGRAIYNCVKQIFNPLTNKMARALVVTPAVSVSKDALKSAYLFIAELAYGFEADIKTKVKLGKQAYKIRYFHNLDLATDEGLDSMFENIWLERLYADLDAYKLDFNHMVTTPLEVDFSASNLTIIGILLGHKDYINPKQYMWKIDGLSKLHVKFAQTPYVFGSSASVQSLWRKNKLVFTDEQVAIMRKAQLIGKFAIANRFKDIVIKHCQPTERMTIKCNTNSFIVECNRYKRVGDTTKQYIVYDSEAKKLKVIRHTNTHKIPDLKQFKRYFSSCLIHNQDSWLEDNICKDMDWILPNHDAGITTWVGASQMRKSAVKWMRIMRDNRKLIVESYLKSINLNDKGWSLYFKLLNDIKKLNKSKRLTISPYLLK